MKKTSKLISVLLAMVLILTMCPVAFADEAADVATPEAVAPVDATTPAAVETADVETPEAADETNAAVITLQINNPVMTVDGEEVAIDDNGTSPVIQNNRTLLPVRAVVEAMGGTVAWDNKTKTATLTCDDDTIKLVIGNTTAYLNDAEEVLDVAPVIINNRTMLPIRFIAESFGAEVGWDNATKTASVLFPGVPEELRAMYDEFMKAVDTDYAYDIAYELSTNTKFMTSALGGRNSGSDAEHAAADWLLQQMKDIGLTNTEKAAAKCDKHQFNGATFTVDGKSYDVYSYATAGTDAKGITGEVVYVGDGTMFDYEGIDVKDKIVLIDIDQRANWWITYPMLEARHQGAAAILAANVGGFAQVADDALNANDICGPVGIPCLSIGLADSQEIQAKISAATTPVTASLVVDNIVEIDKGTTYNVLGKIKGKSSDKQIMVGAHYDMHFFGFQDDNCAVGLVLAMAKAMIDSGYTPENDIVFCLHGAEEWGSSYTQYDWTVGAWEMINNVHPEWAGKTLAFLNFELPAYEFASYTSSYSAPEFYSMIDYFANTWLLSPEPENCFADGIKTEGYQTYTYSDDFSYYASGVPCVINGFLLQEDMETVFDFYIDYYHSNYDLPEIYNEDVMKFNLEYYGAMGMYIDQMPALYLDFTSEYDRLVAAADQETMVAAGVDYAAYMAGAEAIKTNAAALTAKIEKTNADYMRAWIDGDTAAMATLKAEGKALTDKALKAFKFTQDAFLGLMYERPIVPHEAPQENIMLCQEAIGLLEKGDVAGAADGPGWQINGVLEWYAMYFSPEVIDVQDDMFWGADNQDNLYWGTDRTFIKADVEEATRSLIARYEEVGGDYTKEIAVYNAAIESQTALLKTFADREIAQMKTLADALK